MEWFNFLLSSSYSYGSSPDEAIAAIITLLFTGTYLLITLGVIIVTLVISIAVYLIFAILQYKIAKKAGYDNPWFAFIPYLSFYMLYDLPYNRVFNLGIFKIEKRKTAALVGVLVPVGFTLLSPIIGILAIIPFIGYFLVLIIISVFNIVMKAFNWRCYYDLYSWYFEDSTALALSIVGVFVPIVTLVVWFIILKKEPKYNYVNTNEA